MAGSAREGRTPPCCACSTTAHSTPSGLHHARSPALRRTARQTAKQDNSAAAWWAPGAAPSTNAAANGDVQAFWSASAPDPAASIRRLTGRDTAAAVKTAGRGSHIQLGSAGGSFAHSSK